MSHNKLRLIGCVALGGIFLILTPGTSGSVRQSQTATQAATPTVLVIHFTGAANNPILSPGKKGEWDTGSVRFPQVVFDKGTYYLFYGTFQTMDDPVAIGYATSSDGLHWTKFSGNPILGGSGSGFDAFGITRPVVRVEEDGTWTLYYSGIPAPGRVFGTAIGRATAPAPNGPWTRDKEPVLQIGKQGAWDSPFLFPDSVVKDGDQYVMYYSAGFMVGRATSPDGLQWTKYKGPTAESGRYADSDPVLTLGAAGSWDSALAWGSSVQHSPNGWEMFYYGGSDLNGGPGIKIGYAYSADGIAWTKYQNNPIISLDKQDAPFEQFFPTFLLNADSTYSVYYAVTPGGVFTEIHLSTGTITRDGQ